MKFLTVQNISLGAYAARSLACPGAMLEVDTATAPFLITVDGGEEFEIKQGYRLRMGPDGFKGLYLRNNSADTVTIKLYIGSAEAEYTPPASSTLNVQNAQTYSKGSGILSDATKTYAGLDGAKVRKLIALSNLDATNYVDLLDGSDRLLTRVYAGDTKALEVGGTVKVSNVFGINFCVAEVFYS